MDNKMEITFIYMKTALSFKENGQGELWYETY